jgi:hypothetical protein
MGTQRVRRDFSSRRGHGILLGKRSRCDSQASRLGPQGLSSHRRRIIQVYFRSRCDLGRRGGTCLILDYVPIGTAYVSGTEPAVDSAEDRTKRFDSDVVIDDALGPHTRRLMGVTLRPRCQRWPQRASFGLDLTAPCVEIEAQWMMASSILMRAGRWRRAGSFLGHYLSGWMLNTWP